MLLFVASLRANRHSEEYFVYGGPRQQTNPVPRLRRGFEWLNVSATISVDLNLTDPNTAIFIEFLYFT